MHRDPVKKRRLLFDCDGCSVWQDAGGSIDAWLDNVFTGLVDSHVDALMWCDGAGGNTASYDSQVLELTGSRAGITDPNLARALREGNDPPRLVVDGARSRGLDVFYSFRINDCHDAFTPEELPTFKVEHPEWQLGEDAHYGPKTALDFARPEVRDLKLRTIEEIFDRYDFDGIEIDLLRGPPFFRPFWEPRHHYLLTDLLRAVRRSLDEHATRRGRRIEVAIRVDENLLACRLDGFDLSTWLADDLLDILILGSGTIDADVEAFRELAAGSHVQVFPCLYGWPSRYSPVSAPLARGLAANYWHQGADGIYLFNWFPHAAGSAYQVDLLREIGDPAALPGKALTFAADRGFADKPDNYYPYNWRLVPLPAELWPTAASTALSIPVVIGAPLSGQVRLRLEIEKVGDQRIAVTANGHPLPDPSPAEGNWLQADLPASHLVPGVNRFDLRLTSPALAGPPPTVESLEIHTIDPG